MKRLRAFKFRICPTPEQESLLFRHAGCTRFVWNKALDLQKRRLEAGVPLLTYGDMAKLLTLWRESDEYGFLALAPSQPQQQTLKNLDRAIREALDKKNPKRFPRFKRKDEKTSFLYPQGTKLDLGMTGPEWRTVLPRIFLPKVGWVKLRLSRQIEGEIKNVTVGERAGRWSVSVQTEREVPEPTTGIAPEVGLDLGVATFATLSDGTILHPSSELLARMKRAEERLSWEQRKLSRKYRKGAKSRNFAKQKRRLARAHERVANMRLDFLHKTSTAISETQAVVHVEDLKIRNMSRSAWGTVEAPGKKVRQKSGLNRSILSRGWGIFLTLLGYKLSQNGGRLVRVPPQYTSQTCSVCSHVTPENRKTQEAFVCVACGHEENADVNAAKNILRAGQARSACSEAKISESAA